MRYCFSVARLALKILLSALFVAAGILHLADPALFLPIMPPSIPHPVACILLSGVGEILGGLGLLAPGLLIHRVAGLGLILLLIAVFPANIYMATKGIRIHGVPSEPWMAWARLPLQPLLMLAVAWVSDFRRPWRSVEKTS
jgi:uncharacterized membrane protein